MVGLRLSFLADIVCRHFRGEQNPFAVTVLCQRVERGLAAHRARSNHRQLAVKVNGALNDQRWQRVHLCRQCFQCVEVAQ